MHKRNLPYILGSSVTAHFEGARRFGLQLTIDIAQRIESDGVQLYIVPSKFIDGSEDEGQIKDALKKTGLTHNVIHLPGSARPIDLGRETGRAMEIGSRLVTPIPGVGKVQVLHHLPNFAGEAAPSDQDILSAYAHLLERIGDPDITLGLEHFHPDTLTNRANLPDQVDQYINLLRAFQGSGLPAIPVIDLGRFYTKNAQEPLDDPSYTLITRILEAFRGQQVLMHATDCRTLSERITDPTNIVRIGEGVLTPYYQNMITIGKANNIKWIGVVDEEEVLTVQNKEDIQAVKDVFK